MDEEEVNHFALPNWNQTEIAHFRTTSANSKRMTAKTEFVNALRAEVAKEFLNELPDTDEQIHILSNGEFDYWGVIARGIALCKCKIKHLFIASWSLNLPIAHSIVDHIKSGKVQSCVVWLNSFFKRKDPSTWGFLVNNLHELGQKIFSTKTHCKIAAWECEDGRFFVYSGSANLTANPRMEQNFIANSKPLYDFYVETYKKLEK